MNFKKLLALVMCIVFVLGVSACGNTSDEPDEGKNATESNEDENTDSVIELKIPSYKTGENVGAVFFLPQVERFNAKYEGRYKITIEATTQDSFSDMLKQLAQQKALPVLVQGGDADWIKNVVIPNGLAYDLSSWLEEKTAVKDVLLVDSLEYCTVDGATYVLPLATVRASGYFYNSAMWNTDADLSTLTVDEFIAELGDQKIAFSTAENGWVAGLFYTALIANQEGGAELLSGGTANKITDFNNEIFINATAQLQQMLKNNAFNNSIGAAYPDAANAFMSSQAAVIGNGPWMSADFEESNSANWSNDFNGGDVRAAFYPGNVGIANTATYGEWWISSSASEEEVECALAFLEFLYSPEELEAFLLAEGGDAPNLTYSEEFAAKQAETQVLADLAADASDEATFVPCFLDVIPNSVANSDFGRLLPSLADDTYTPEQFCQMLTQAAVEATAE